MPSPVGVELASLTRFAEVDEIALATFEAAIVVAGEDVDVPFAPAAAAGNVEDEERTVILGVDVTPAFSVARRKLGIDRAGCGRVAAALVPTDDAVNLGVEPSLDDAKPEAVEPAVPGRCVLLCCAVVDVVLSEARVVVES